MELKRATSIELTDDGRLILIFKQPVAIEERHEVERALEAIGFEVSGGGTDLATGEMDISTRPIARR